MPALAADHAFLNRHAEHIHGVLACFDRLIFRGYLPLSYAQGLEGFLSRQGQLLKDFKTYAPQVAERLVAHVTALVTAAGREIRYLPKKERLEARARQIARDQQISEGIVCAFRCLETCRTYRLQYGEGRPRLKADYRRCQVLYVFLIDPTLGLLHVKLETWFPLTLQVYVNGHEFVARKLTQLGLSYTQVENTFTHLEKPSAAQGCAERFVKQDWPKVLGALARQFNPLLEAELQGQDYYWCVDQAEYATDVIFKDRAALAAVYPRLVEHATLGLQSADVLRFLGRRLHPSLEQEVQTHRGERVEGVRVKHGVGSNRLKMYDKAGVVLRIETVINDPTAFKVRRWRQTKDGRRELAWQPLRKGVAGLWRYAEVSAAANGRYLEALAAVDEQARVRAELDAATKPARLGGRRVRALQPLSPAEQALFRAVLAGQHRLQGFRAADVAQVWYPRPAAAAAERRRRSGRVTRLIRLLRGHGLVKKVPRSRRYHVTAKGERVMLAAIMVKHKHLPQEMSAAG